MYVYALYVLNNTERQKSVWDPLELEFQMI